MDAPHAELLCPTCLRSLTPWPPPHERTFRLAPLSSPEAGGSGDRFSCQTTLCNRYGFVVRRRSLPVSRVG